MAAPERVLELALVIKGCCFRARSSQPGPHYSIRRTVAIQPARQSGGHRA